MNKPDSKIAWIDTETTGVDAKKNSVIQIAIIAEINDEPVFEKEYFLRPLPNKQIDQGALDVNGRTREELETFPPAIVAVKDIQKQLGRFIDQYDRNDKFVPAGFRVGFDRDFLINLFKDVRQKYYGSYFYQTELDVYSLLGEAVAYHGLRLPKYRLIDVCNHFEIDISGAHDALVDIRATKQCYKALKSFINKG